MKNEQLFKTAIKWLNKNYGNLELYDTEKYTDYIFYMKNGEIIFDYNKKNGRAYISYEHIWLFFSNVFGMEYEQIQEVTKLWVEEHYKLDVTTTTKRFKKGLTSVEEHYKLDVTTTRYRKTYSIWWWRNIIKN
jgi:hypothetical protein